VNRVAFHDYFLKSSGHATITCERDDRDRKGAGSAWISFARICALGLVFAACACSARASKEDIAKTLEENPGLVMRILEKNKKQVVQILVGDIDEDDARATATPGAERKRSPSAASAGPRVPEIEPGRVFLGPPNARVTIVAYSDFECPYCADAAATIRELLKKYPRDVRFLFKHNTLEGHAGAKVAARYFEALARQSATAAFAYHDRVFERQEQLDEIGDDDVKAREAFFRQIALELGNDAAKLDAALKSPDLDAQIAKDRAEAQRFGFDGTPRFLVNTETVEGSAPIEEFVGLVEKAMKAAPAAASAAASPKK
jgi:protein-disulfide isomerase